MLSEERRRAATGGELSTRLRLLVRRRVTGATRQTGVQESQND